MIERISQVEGGPSAIGPYSLAVIAEGRFVFISGQTPFDPAVGAIVCGSVAEQTELVLKNLQRIIAAAGGNLSDVVNCRVYLSQLTEKRFSEMNAVFAAFFGDHKPSRTTIGCQLLNMDVEIDAVVRLPG